MAFSGESVIFRYVTYTIPEIQAKFSDLSDQQSGDFINASADSTLKEAIFGLTYDESTGKFPVRPIQWCGRFKGSPEAGSLDMIRHVYLPPLRDAKRSLASGNPTRIFALLKHFLGDGDPEQLAKALSRTESAPILEQVDGAVDVGLRALTSGVRRQAASLGFAKDEKLIDIARDLRFKLADHGIEPEDLRYSGHGYANLLYMATIAVELENVNNAHLTLFLVEEPEAHLHPQLQAAVLSFLEEQAEKSYTPTTGADGGPAGQLQVVVATHSPNLSAWVKSENLVFFRSFVPKVLTSTLQTGDAAAPISTPAALPLQLGGQEAVADAVAALPSRRATRCIPLNALALSDVDRRKVDRYLDVTKSAFLFGGRILLVEGIAEALLLPVIAKNIVLKDDPEKFRQFRSAVFVPIDGVDFDPYVRLLLSPYDEVRIAERVVVVTDGDRTAEHVDKPSPGDRRKAKLEAIAVECSAVSFLTILVNTYSLETELVEADNSNLLKSVYITLHSQSEAKWNEAVALSGDQRAAAIQKLFETTRKGDFAQILAEKIENGEAFHVPAYIKDAIEAVVA